MPRRHPGSLIPKYLHDPALLKLMNSPLSNDMIECVANKTIDAVRCRPPPDTPPTPPHTPGSDPIDKLARESGLPALPVFIKSIVRKSKCHVPTLLCTLVFLERLKERLPPHARGCHTTRHRVFLATLIVTAKYLNDSSPQNKHWVRDAEHFSATEVNLMEHQLLEILNFDLRFDESELTRAITPLLQLIRVQQSRSRSSSSLTPTSVADSEMTVVAHSGQNEREDDVRPHRPYRQPALAVETGNCDKRLAPAYVRTTTARPRLPQPVSGVRGSLVRNPAAPALHLTIERPPRNPARPALSHSRRYSTTPPTSPAPASPLTRTSRPLSSSSTSTLSSTSSGPRTPCTPGTFDPVLRSCRSSSLAAMASSKPSLGPLCTSAAPPSPPSTVCASPNDPDPWRLMAAASTTFSSGERLVKGELRLEPAHTRGGMLGLNLRAADRTEAVFVME
ncbi:hypothetical protein JCM5296_003769 [Sporobolomyces johnsonii]